ncbi:HD domain-containing phosphohydrolase [Trichloromonas sp.]|uniref:HD domain-containing phosphohydrolase n=1 Tax=Trichloromonas sp. TaxID=3069249 RepID=UPI002A4A3214|nr:HD domain-containing phosphohydrolase [Trichloromonas sp.]
MLSLKTKFLILSTLIALMVVSLSIWHHLSAQRETLNQLALQHSRILGDTIRNSVITFMRSGENDRVAQILKEIQTEPSLELVQIFDESGRILRAGNPESVGDLVPAIDLIAYRSQQFSSRHEHNGRLYQARILPIFNEPDCHSCHDPSERVLGILSIHIAIDDLASMHKDLNFRAMASSIPMILFLILAITGFVLYYVEKPLRSLVGAMNHLERGEFDQATVSLTNSKEMSQLSDKFNRMVERLRGQIQEMVRQEREIAISKEKLAHQEQIETMNSTLEERLKEIEYLNTSLEQRIGEIEEANYRIADLAGELESKNTTLQQAVTRLSALYNMGLAINSTMNQSKLFHLLIEATVDTLKASAGYILLFDRETHELTIDGSFGLPTPPTSGMRIPLETGGVSHWVIENRKPLLIQNINDAGHFNKVSRLGFTRETVICAPLMVNGEPIGTITMANRRDGSSFYTEDLELLSTIAAQASIAIKNAQLYEEQQNTYLNTVQALVSAIEASDAYTHGHSERVTRISLALGRRLSLPPERLKRLEQAAILHDIGKIGIDRELLHKKGDLTDQNVQALHQHPLIGVKILEPIQFLKDVRKIIAQHHERYDGKGYPNHLKGDEILMEARILTVADTFDAMISDRPYREALSFAAAVEEIRNNTGTQFDPVVAETFLKMVQKGGWHQHIPVRSGAPQQVIGDPVVSLDVNASTGH